MNAQDVDFKVFLIKPKYFTDHSQLIKEGNTKEKRMYLGIIINIGENYCFIPFESKLANNPRLDCAQWRLPSTTRPEAGLNFEKCLIINDLSYVECLENPKLANSQKGGIQENKSEIKNKLNLYLQKYVTAFQKGRHKKDFIFKYTTLSCYHDELGLKKSDE